MKDGKFMSLFRESKPIIGMIHLNCLYGNVIKNALKEIEIMSECGIDAVLVENYFGTNKDVRDVLSNLYHNNSKTIYGVNILSRKNSVEEGFVEAFDLANEYGASFIQVDSIAGHLKEDHDLLFGQIINRFRSISDAALIGGVRFKYQPILSNRSVQEDIAIGRTRCDGIVVTGNATGVETDIQKLRSFKTLLQDFPVIVGAGLNLKNVDTQLRIADAAIVGSYLKEDHIDSGELSPVYTNEFMCKVKELRKQL